MGSQKSIQELLNKYWAAETTPEEEAILKDTKLEDEAAEAYFSFLRKEREVVMQGQLQPVARGKIRPLRRIISIAAAVIVLVSAGVLIQTLMIPGISAPEATHQEYHDSFDNPEQAYEETRAALLLVSAKINKSRKLADEQLSKTQPYIEILK